MTRPNITDSETTISWQTSQPTSSYIALGIKEHKEQVVMFFLQAEDGIRDLTVTGVQTCALPISMSIAGNVTVGLRLNGVRSRAALAELTEKSLRMAALWDEVKDRLHAPALSLSGGQQQRLCIARALAVQPEVLLMDEPASALDPIATAKIEDLILELKKEFTIVIVTHNMQQAARISDYTAFLYLGELIEFDSTRKLFTNPTKKQTEDYVTGRFG